MRILAATFCLLLPQFANAMGGQVYGGSIYTGADAATIQRCQTTDKWDRAKAPRQDVNAPQMEITIYQGNEDELVEVLVLQNGQVLSQQDYDTSTGTGIPSTDDSGRRITTFTEGGRFGVDYLDRHHRSSQFQDAPMYNAIFFNGGQALHGTVPSNDRYLGRPASHGCARLKRAQSLELFQAVCEIGPQNVRINVVGTVDPGKSSESTSEKISSASRQRRSRAPAEANIDPGYGVPDSDPGFTSPGLY